MNSTYSVLAKPVLVTENLLPMPLHKPNRRSTWSPSLREIIDTFGPLPDDTLLLGQGEDGKAILLNLQEVSLGPLLIKGDSGTGKTHFLLSIAKFVEIAYTPEKMQYCVITPYTEEWQESLSESRNCVGVFTSGNANVCCLIQSLAAWLHKGARSGQTILFLVDGLEYTSKWDVETQTYMEAVLKHGAKQRVWTIATVNWQTQVDVFWLDLFGVHLVSSPPNTERLPPMIATLVGPRFGIYQGDRWIRFWIPSLDEQ